jgi:hypothetical protein
MDDNLIHTSEYVHNKSNFMKCLYTRPFRMITLYCKKLLRFSASKWHQLSYVRVTIQENSIGFTRQSVPDTTNAQQLSASRDKTNSVNFEQEHVHDALFTNLQSCTLLLLIYCKEALVSFVLIIFGLII